MMSQVQALSSGPLSVKRVGASIWILRLESLEFCAVPALREAFHQAIDRDAGDVVVDLTSVRSVSIEGAAALAEMADLMRGRGGALWIAAPRREGNGLTLRAVHGPTPDGLSGASPALDGALGSLSGGVRTGFSVREASAILADRFEESALDVSDFTGAAA